MLIYNLFKFLIFGKPTSGVNIMDSKPTLHTVYPKDWDKQSFNSVMENTHEQLQILQAKLAQ